MDDGHISTVSSCRRVPVTEVDQKRPRTYVIYFKLYTTTTTCVHNVCTHTYVYVGTVY